MTEANSTKPYMIRAIHEWCVDNNMTPHLLVVVDSHARVPMAYVKDGEIVLNLSYGATKDLHIDNEAVTFSARFGGNSQNLYVPIHAVKGIFARESGQGMFFELGEASLPKNSADNSFESPEVKQKDTNLKKPLLTIVK